MYCYYCGSLMDDSEKECICPKCKTIRETMKKETKKNYVQPISGYNNPSVPNNNLMLCPSCRRPIAKGAITCPYCGLPIRATVVQKSSGSGAVLFGTFTISSLLIGIAAILLLFLPIIGLCALL